MISPQKLKYNGHEINEYLNDFDVILDVSFDSDNGAMSTFLNRSAVSAESYDGRYKNTHRYKYDELFSPQFTIVKKDFSDFSQYEVRKILKYLTQTDKPALLEVSYDKDEAIVEEDRDFCAIGGWTSIETYKIANSRTVGIIATFEAITPYAMSKLITKQFEGQNGYSGTITINTDDGMPIYPRITVKHNGLVILIDKEFSSLLDMADCVENTVYYNNGTYYWKTPDMDTYNFQHSTTQPNIVTTSVKIINERWNEDELEYRTKTTVKNNNSDEQIIIDGSNKIISSNTPKRIFGDDFVDWAWLPLYDGDNHITIEGNCDVTFEYREIRKIGEY